VEFIPNYLTTQTFASGFDWDGVSPEISVVIPNTMEFYNSSRTFHVTKLGGFYGRDVPCAFSPMLPVGSGAGQVIFSEPNELASARERYPDAPVRNLTAHLIVGQYLSDVPLPAASLLYREQEGDGAIWRVAYGVDCDKNNQTFYSENGRLYLRANDTPVAQLRYGEDG